MSDAATRRRLCVRRATPVVLALFVATVAMPRTGLLVHHHAGGDAPHVHLDADGGDDAHLHHHHHAGDDVDDHPPLRPGETALDAPDPTSTWHAHASHPFQPAVRYSLPRALRAERIAPLGAPAPYTVVASAAGVEKARAPPSPIAL